MLYGSRPAGFCINAMDLLFVFNAYDFSMRLILKNIAVIFWAFCSAMPALAWETTWMGSWLCKEIPEKNPTSWGTLFLDTNLPRISYKSHTGVGEKEDPYFLGGMSNSKLKLIAASEQVAIFHSFNTHGEWPDANLSSEKVTLNSDNTLEISWAPFHYTDRDITKVETDRWNFRCSKID